MQLVLTPPLDAQADHLIDRLRARGAEVVRFNPTDFPARAEISLEHTSSGTIRTQLRASGHSVDLDRVRSVFWCPTVEHELFSSLKSFAQDAWSFITAAWLPARPAVVQRAQVKAVQFAIAGHLGFELPRLVSPHTRDVRVIVVGERVFAAQLGAYGSHRLPDELQLSCMRLVRYLGLRFAAIDLLRTPDGRYVFVGLNPNGQYLWLERATGLPITDALVDEMLGTAARQRASVPFGLESGVMGVAA